MSLRLRRGGFSGGAAPPVETYGPSGGTQPIRDGAGPRTVADPGGGVTFTPASNIQTLIDSNAYNTLFRTTTAGTYNNFRNLVYSAKHPRFYFVGAASSYSIHGGDTDNLGLNGTGTGANGGLEIYGGTWTHYGLPTGTTVSVGPVNIGGGGGASIIQDAVFTANAQIGVQGFMNASDSGTMATLLVSHCTLSSNGRYGLSMTGSATAGRQYQPTVEYCRIEGNNTRGFATGDNASAQKFGYSNGGIWRNNWYKANTGHGIWVDGYNVNVSMRDNVVEDNTEIGIFFEISRGASVLEHNYLIRNGSTTDTNYAFNGVALVVSNSPSDGTGPSIPGPNTTSEIRYNDIDTSGYQSPIVLYNHSVHAATERTRNWYIHHNRMWQRGATGQSRVGLYDACTIGSPKEGDIGLASSNNDFDYNEYHQADTSAGAEYWNHDTSNQFPGALTYVEFKARGHEVNGTRTTL